MPVAIRNSRLTDQEGPFHKELDAALWKRHGFSARGPNDTQAAKIREQIAADPEFYIFGGFVRTFDETAAPADRVRPFPDKPYLRRALQFLHDGYPDDSVAAAVKSRQLTWSWLAGAYGSWECRHPHSRVIFQSKKAEDAWKFVYDGDWTHARVGFIEYAQPLQVRMTGLIGKRGELLYPGGSEFWGVPQGPHMFRSYTATLVICDEAAFQPEFREAFKAALPMARRIVVISTAQGGSFFGDIVEQNEEEEVA